MRIDANYDHNNADVLHYIIFIPQNLTVYSSTLCLSYLFIPILQPCEVNAFKPIIARSDISQHSANTWRRHINILLQYIAYTQEQLHNSNLLCDIGMQAIIIIVVVVIIAMMTMIKAMIVKIMCRRNLHCVSKNRTPGICLN